MPPIFVVGAPRTGTTLVKEILNRHPRVHLFDEVHFFERVWDDRAAIGDLASPMSQSTAIQRVRDIVSRYGSDAEIAEILTVEEYRRRLMSEGRQYRNLFRILLETGAQRHGADCWGDSSPQDVLYLDRIFEWYPEARIVALIRDPRGYLSSCKNYFRRQVATYRERSNPLTQAMLWRTYMSAATEAAAGPHASSVLMLRYEDLVSDPETWVRRLAEHVRVEFDPGMLAVDRANTSFPEADAPVRGIFDASKDRWRTELTPTEIWIAERICGELMRKLAYEPALLSSGQRAKPAVSELLKIAALLPSRAYRHVFHSHKPLRMGKVKRVLDHLRPSGASGAARRTK
ncbi:MAG: sulfotransferase [Gemmatimonadetes bacterium]|nr:sulfotransferase [Gemmatimonadota bacterium]